MAPRDISIDPSSLAQFANQTAHEADKYVLYLKNGKLEAKRVSETSLFERVQAWFGVGPLSLKNISRFIQDHNVFKSKNDAHLAVKFIEKCEHYNKSHRILKVSRTFLRTLSQNLRLGYTDASTLTKGKTQNAITDIAFADKEHQTAFVMDMSKVAPESKKNLEALQEKYIKSLDQQKFSSIREAEDWFEEQLQVLQTIAPNTSVGWVQKVEVGGRLYLLTCQKGSVTTLIKHADGSLKRVVSGEAKKLNFFTDEIDITDVVVGVTDGLGNYVTEKEMQQALANIDHDINSVWSSLIDQVTLRQNPLSDKWGKDVIPLLTDLEKPLFKNLEIKLKRNQSFTEEEVNNIIIQVPNERRSIVQSIIKPVLFGRETKPSISGQPKIKIITQQTPGDDVALFILR